MAAGSVPDSGTAPLAPVPLLGRCPRCGSGPLLSGVLAVRDACPACGLDLGAHDLGNGPAVAGIFIVGVLAVIATLVVDVTYEPPLWLHALLWPVLVLSLPLLVVRIAKALPVAPRYRQRLGAPGG